MKKIIKLFCVGIVLFMLSGCNNTQKFERIVKKIDSYDSYTATVLIKLGEETSSTVMEVDNVNKTAKIIVDSTEVNSESYYKNNENDTTTLYIKLSDTWYKSITNKDNYEDAIENHETQFVDKSLKIEKVNSETDENKYEVLVNFSEIEDSTYDGKVFINYYVKDSVVKRITYEIDNIFYEINYSKINSTVVEIPNDVLNATAIN